MERESLDRISILMKQKNISISNLSKLTNIPKTTIHDIINGKYQTTSADKIFSIANALGVSVDYIRFGLDNDSELLSISSTLNDMDSTCY